MESKIEQFELKMINFKNKYFHLKAHQYKLEKEIKIDDYNLLFIEGDQSQTYDFISDQIHKLQQSKLQESKKVKIITQILNTQYQNKTIQLQMLQQQKEKYLNLISPYLKDLQTYLQSNNLTKHLQYLKFIQNFDFQKDFHWKLDYGEFFKNKFHKHLKTADQSYQYQHNRNSLHICAIGGYSQTMQQLIKDNININEKDEFGFTPLHYSSEYNNLTCTQILLNNDLDINAKSNYGKTALHYASEQGNLKTMEALLDKKADINALDTFNRSCLHNVAKKGNLDCLRYLVQSKCEIDAKDIYGMMPIHLAAIWGSLQCVKYLISQNCQFNATDNYNRTPLGLCESKKVRNYLRIIIEKKAKKQLNQLTQNQILNYNIMNKKSIFKQIISKINIDNDYEIDGKQKKLGKGNFGVVVIGEHKLTGEIRAIKIVSKKKMKKKGVDINLLENEAKIMMQMDHPNVVKFYDVYEDEGYLYFILEYLKGGELLDKFINDFDKKINEELIRNIFKQLILALQYLHKNGIAHRDIKAENLMFVDDTMQKIKLIDFGVSKYFFDPSLPQKEITLRTTTGSLFYICPEVAAQNKKYDYKCDIWSAGVLLYLMVCRMPPFYHQNDYIVLEMVKNIEYNFNDKIWKDVSPDLIDLIKHMLIQWKNRFDASQILHHKWMNIDLPKKDFKINVDGVKKFFKAPELARYVRQMIVTLKSEQKPGFVEDMFIQMDEDGDGLLNKQELIEGIEEFYQIHDTDLIDLIEDKYSEDDQIGYTEFQAIITDMTGYGNYSDEIDKIFSLFDIDKKGEFNEQQMKNTLKKYHVIDKDDYKDNPELFNGIFKEVVKDSGDVITSKLFKSMFTL